MSYKPPGSSGNAKIWLYTKEKSAEVAPAEKKAPVKKITDESKKDEV